MSKRNSRNGKGADRVGSGMPSQTRTGARSNAGATTHIQHDTGTGPRALQRLIGESLALRRIRARIQELATKKLPILFQGETGTGKEVGIRAVHELSGLKIFIALNCGALATDLLDSELFGHELGAFTGAVTNRVGLIAAANGGILFLDEVTELTPAAQSKLLRAIEYGEIRPVGSSSIQISHFRLLAATNADIDVLAERGQFRKDLLYRLGKARIVMPPLRERPEDIVLIARSMLQQWRQESGSGPRELSTDAVKILMEQHWPGNVRELRGVLELAAALADGVDVLEAKHLREHLPNAANDATVAECGQPLRVRRLLEDVRAIADELRKSGGNRKKAALALKISPATLYRTVAAAKALKTDWQVS